MEIKTLLQLSLLYRPKSSKLNVNGEGREVALQIGDKTVKGFPSSALAIFEASNIKSPPGVDFAILHHWLSYCSTELFHCANNQDLTQCLQYVDAQLLHRPYLCGFIQSLADVVFFIGLEPIVKNWSFQTKEQYINISRWFSTLQETIDSNDQTSSKVYFSKTLLYSDFNSLKVK